jgi:adiponectin receptor
MRCIFFIVVEFQSDEYTEVRGGLFVAFGALGVAPCFHSYVINDYEWDLPHTNLIVMGAIYIFGAFFFVTGFPNMYYPGKFDLVGSNHQIFHLCVVIAAVYHWVQWSQHLTTLTDSPCWS